MCKCFREDVLLDYRQGRLSLADARSLEGHLGECPACRKALDDLTVLLGVMAQPMVAEPSAFADQLVQQTIQESLSRRAAARRRARFRPLPGRMAWWSGAAASVALVVGAALSWWFGWLSPTAAAQPIVATLTSIQANVMVRRNGVEQVAAVGMVLRRHDTLTVPANGSAVLTFPTNTRAELGPDTTLALTVPAAGDTEYTALHLHEGFLAVDAVQQSSDPPMRIRTAEAEAEVRDTRCTLGAEEGRTNLRVAEGRVNLTRVRDGKLVAVLAGSRSTVAADADLKPVPSRSGTVLQIVSQEKRFPDWERFNRLVGSRLVGSRLWRIGLRVETRFFHELKAEDLAGRPLVIVSLFDYNTGAEESLGRVGLAQTAVPVLSFEPAAYPVLGMTGPTEKVDFGFGDGRMCLDFPNPAHPLAGGLAGKKVELFGKAGCCGWARPADSAVTVAHLSGKPQQATVFGYETGAAMIGRDAPARRVGLFLDPWRLEEGSTTAWTLVEAAVDWCVAAEPRPNNP